MEPIKEVQNVERSSPKNFEPSPKNEGIAKTNGQISCRIDRIERRKIYDLAKPEDSQNGVIWGWLVDDMGAICAAKK
ncbi:MAG TPA: hypothetical protein VM842_05830 [Nitrospira sp.]|jgi:hypothetical protein|nr:hypothetical protein [Nitrospira sp.]